MFKSFLNIIFIIFIISAGCSENKQRLIVDEIYISKHNIESAYDYRLDIEFVNDIPRIISVPLMPCQKGIKILERYYRPTLIARINSDGVLFGEYKEFTKTNFSSECPKHGFVKITLSDSMINYINEQTQRMDYKKLDSFYASKYEGSGEYYISIKNGNEEKQILLVRNYHGAKILRKLVDSLYNYVGTLELSDTLTIPNRKDSLIVLRSEKYSRELAEPIIFE